ncbi:MAG TPA: ATP-grasp domain-containing protein [Gemmataceae bacterium]|jgi:predicted ATP-grasp superfamily ATP-dependent carboligase
MTQYLLIFGASARAAAFSALRSGLCSWCLDLFADVDLQNRCSVSRLTGHYPYAFLDHLDAAPPSPWMYTGGLENWPRLVRRMSEHRTLWGNTAETLFRARDPEFVTDLLQAAGMPTPALCRPEERSEVGRRWLCKPRRGAGGIGIQFAPEETSDEPSIYLQEYIEGRPCSLLYLGDGRQACLLGMTWQLAGVSWLHAGAFRYGGSIGPVDPGIVRRPSLQTLGDLLTGECGLCGLFGVDGILCEGVFWPVEINPRYTASVEVLEYATGLPAVAWHEHVFTHGQLPSLSPPAIPSERSIGKAILFAREDLLFPADGPWMAELRSPTPVHELPAFADIPAAGERIEAGRPVLTFFAVAGSPSACEEALRQSAADLDRWLFER